VDLDEILSRGDDIEVDLWVQLLNQSADLDEILYGGDVIE
jgi:hypothetical protein